jgi:hypothetical protein
METQARRFMAAPTLAPRPVRPTTTLRPIYRPGSNIKRPQKPMPVVITDARS